MQFRPCIDLHNGKVKQIVGSTLSDDDPGSLKTNFTAKHPSSWFAKLYKRDNLTGGHIIKLGPGNDEAAKEALAAWPGGMQIGGGIAAENGKEWLDCGASHVIVTSYVFSGGQIDYSRLQKLVKAVGKENLVLDLSCRRRGEDYYIVTDRWQKFTDVMISPAILEEFAKLCDEFLIHAADVEGQCKGIEIDLVKRLADWSPIPATYAGGVKDIDDMLLIRDIGRDRLHATVGSALDIFGGSTMTYDEVVVLHKKHFQQ
ncbi:MAG: phosphoribosylformimino-5-aminoimidazole carboxamide ribotide isomerase [Desulfocapsa sp.]|jgi:phosphoribosylformimino-5-aminoimidazole carboxamide ribotide isomerase|uniref:Phosphoribosylformimino-5-aminoimidazole carboxamide ribotide isomerase n=1 Tax=Desulfotalea psychrophila TaxID=84980 RepID=A0ABS3AVT2_9BACT|nr:phosphoribosylformimino-5-aminoimidazole carboxamide ribotide isomerase [Desulfocapsa sp.]MBN4060147.1 phosphoribosylformimino-5-aminoimidazole carboxamide ribotide isomerase [Desulfotalea psychrophila]MBN4068772.1 phosphoribosylformimino-5-aminoimidazole carboxamide ribotide isomerase [Desulfotalea psychrophila]